MLTNKIYITEICVTRKNVLNRELQIQNAFTFNEKVCHTHRQTHTLVSLYKSDIALVKKSRCHICEQ